MDNYNIEKVFKQFFEKRQIKPSANAWDRMDVMLSLAEKPNKPKSITYYLAAVCFLTIIMLSYYHYNRTTDAYKKNQAGKITSHPERYNAVLDNECPTSPINEAYTDTVNVSKPIKIRQLPKKEVVKQQIYATKVLPLKSNEALVLIENGQKSDIIISNNKNIEKTNPTSMVTSSELSQNLMPKIHIQPNSLLSLVEAKIEEKKMVDFHKEIKKMYGISPKTLLAKAEDMSAQTFMSKVWRTIQDKSTPVITAVANRNQ